MGTAAMVDRLRLGDHVCWTVDDNRLAATAQLAGAGIEAGHRIVYLTESLQPPALLAGLESLGVPAERAQRSGQLKVLPAERAYLTGGSFDPDRTLATLGEQIEDADAAGYAGLRLITDMSWVLRDPGGVDRLTWYEAQTNRLFMDGRALGVCLYDRRSFPTELLRQVAGAHPATTPVRVDPEWMPLLRATRTSDRYGLRLFGEADLSNRQALAAMLDAVIAEQPQGAQPMLVDVSGLRFADAATAALLVRAARSAPAGLHLSGCRGEVALMVDRLGLSAVPGLRITYASPREEELC